MLKSESLEPELNCISVHNWETLLTSSVPIGTPGNEFGPGGHDWTMEKRSKKNTGKSASVKQKQKNNLFF